MSGCCTLVLPVLLGLASSLYMTSVHAHKAPRNVDGDVKRQAGSYPQINGSPQILLTWTSHLHQGKLITPCRLIALAYYSTSPQHKRLTQSPFLRENNTIQVAATATAHALAHTPHTQRVNRISRVSLHLSVNQSRGSGRLFITTITQTNGYKCISVTIYIFKNHVKRLTGEKSRPSNWHLGG